MPTQRLTSEFATVLDIRDYGSNVGGGGDDQPAIAAACAAASRSGAPVFVPAGTFLVVEY